MSDPLENFGRVTDRFHETLTGVDTPSPLTKLVRVDRAGEVVGQVVLTRNPSSA